MRIVLTIFAPFLTAIGIRLVLVLVGLTICFVGKLFDAFKFDTFTFIDFGDRISGFDTFEWDESWCYWILVIIGTFIAESIIWGATDDEWKS